MFLLGVIMANHWSEYWLQGHLTSFGDSFKGNYQGALKDVWKSQSRKLSNGFKVLDIATGNGAIPLVFRELLSEQIEGVVTGVDLAEVKTTPLVNESSKVNIELLSNINCEQLDLEDGQFDLVVSQFGIEYSKLSLSIPEALRVCKNGGQLCFVMHHDKSMVIERNSQILKMLSEINEKKLLTTLSELIEAMGEITSAEDLAKVKQDSSCEALRKQLNDKINQLVSVNEKALIDTELMTYLANIFKNGLFWSLEKKRDYLTFMNEQLAELKERLKELVAAARDEYKLAEMLSLIAKFNGRLCSISTLTNDEEQVLGWNIIINKG